MSTELKFKLNTAERIENTKIIESKDSPGSPTPSFPVKTSSTENDSNNSPSTITAQSSEEKNSFPHLRGDEDLKEDFESWPPSFCLPSATASDTTFKIEVMDNKENTGECVSFGKLKKLKSIGVQIDNETEIESEDDIHCSELQSTENLSLKSSESSRFSWNRLPLTGDLEVDEEILKFYKARYKMFRKEEKRDLHE